MDSAGYSTNSEESRVDCKKYLTNQSDGCADFALKPKCRGRCSGCNRNAPDPARCADRREIMAPALGGSRRNAIGSGRWMQETNEGDQSVTVTTSGLTAGSDTIAERRGFAASMVIRGDFLFRAIAPGRNVRSTQHRLVAACVLGMTSQRAATDRGLAG